jgi:hypothetical protein
MATRTQRSTILFALLVTLMLAAGAANATDKKTREQCAKIDRDIRRIEARMRRPYSAGQGIRLDERLRELRDRRYRLCR